MHNSVKFDLCKSPGPIKYVEKRISNHFISDYDLNSACNDVCFEELFECTLLCDLNDFECVYDCLRAEAVCIESKYFMFVISV